jgi:hypothetical protein
MQAFISVREWFDKANGNSYYGLTVVDSAGFSARSTMLHYGRGDAAYIHIAKLLLGGGVANEYTYTVVDVVRVGSKRAACFK